MTTYASKVCSWKSKQSPQVLTNVPALEYDDLEARIAAELVIRAKAKSSAPQPSAQSQYQIPPQAYGAPQYAQPPPQVPLQHQAPAPAGQQPNIANLITSLDGPALQKLLGAMQQSPKVAQAPQHNAPPQHIPQQQIPQTQDLAALLGNAARQQLPAQPPPNQQGYPYQQQPMQRQSSQQYQYGTPYQGQQQIMPSQHQQPQQGQHEQQHVQNIMEQLAKWKQ